MRKGLLLGVVAVTLLWAKPAHADGFAWDNYCINDAFVVCASVRISVTDAGVLTMQVWNLQGTVLDGHPLGIAHTINAVGLYHTGGWTGSGALVDATYMGGSIKDAWEANANNIKTLGGVNASIKSGAGGNAGVNGCLELPGGTKWLTCQSFPGSPFVEFTFNLSDWNSTYSAEDFELRWHSKQVAGDYSLKCDTGGAGDYGPCTQVPEPITLALLGSGLASMGGVGLLRRRKKGLDV